MGLIRTLLIIAVIYYGIKFLGKLFAPYLQKYAAKKMQEKFNQQFNGGNQNYQQDTKREPEGKTSVYTKPQNKSNFNSNDTGDYIDFEEVDDK